MYHQQGAELNQSDKNIEFFPAKVTIIFELVMVF